MPINKLIKRLESIKLTYTSEATLQKKEILNNLLILNFKEVAHIVHFHDLLLFFKAYADDVNIFSLAEEGIKKLTNDINHIKNKEDVVNSGIANTLIEAAYNFDILRALLTPYVFFLEFDSFGADEEELYEVFSLVSNDLEQVAFSEEGFNIHEWIAHSFSSNPKEKLHQIIQIIENGVDNEKVKTHLFSKLKVFT